MKRDKKDDLKTKKHLDIEEISEEKQEIKKSPIKNILLIISIILLLAVIGLCGYLFYQNITLEKEVNDNKANIAKIQEKINNDEKTLDEKENEYEKLKETVKEKFEELSIWEETKENLNKSLS